MAPQRPKLVGDKDRLIPPEQRGEVIAFINGEGRADHEVARLAILLGDQAGLRINEACQLTVADCDIRRKPYRLLIRGAKHRDADHVDEQPIGPDLAHELTSWITYRELGPEKTVLKGSTKPYSRQHVLALVKAVHRACGLDEVYNFHSWRHGYGTRIYLKTRDLVLTSRMLRHRSTKPTEKYVHMATAMEEMDEVLAAVAATVDAPATPNKKSTKRPKGRKGKR